MPAFVAVAVLVVLAGCDARRRDWTSCWQEPCGPGQVCTSDHRCVQSVPDASPPDAAADAGTRPEAAADARPAADAPLLGPDVGDTAADAAPVLDVALDAVTAGDGAALQAGDAGIDARVADGAGTCAGDRDCAASGMPFCVAGSCVACRNAADCQGSTPVCSAAHACVSCAGVDAGCAGTAALCEVDSGRCMECLADPDCTTPARAFCMSGTCASCAEAGAGACARRDPRKPVCVAAGCVECASNGDCALASKPVCDASTHACVPCAADGDCASQPGPGVCMGDGHCATDAETLYVGARAAGCSDANGAGSATVPYCTAQLAVTAAKARAIPLLVLSGSIAGGFTGVSLTAPLTVVGKNAVLTPAPGADGIGIVSGSLRLRGLTIQGNAGTSTGLGINAAASSGAQVMLTMESCAVTDNPGGGIFLNGAAFVITNTNVSRNGPSPTAWGGIDVQNPPSAGPTTLAQVSITNNKQVGLACSSSIAATDSGSGVLASGNGTDITSTCGITSCIAGTAACGAQSAP